MKNKALVIIPFALPWDWSADYEKQTAITLAKMRHQVIAYIHRDARFILKPRPIKGFSRKQDILFFQPRYPIPFRRFIFIESLNQLLNMFYLYMRYGFLRRRKVILWIFNPIFWFHSWLFRLVPNSNSLYDCVDYAWSHKAKEAKKIQEHEKRLICLVDYFFVNSNTLARLHSRIRSPDGIVPQGFDVRNYKSISQASAQLPKDKPVIGYIGSIDYRIDFFLLCALIKGNSQWNFVFWGPLHEYNNIQNRDRDINTLQKFPNVFFGKSTDRSHVPAIIEQFSVGIIPYKLSSPLNRYCYPMKLFEYFYMGKPVTATPIEELKRFPKYVKIGSTVKKWERHIKYLLSHPWPKEYQREQRRLAVENSWERKLEAITKLI